MSREPSFLPHHLLFVLPPVQASPAEVPAVQALPAQQAVTGDQELDALLWLREVIKSGQPGPINTALEAAKRIKTPLRTLAERYAKYLVHSTGNTLAGVFGSFGLDDLEGLAQKSIANAQRKTEAEARFPGGTIWNDTPAEVFCIRALYRMKGAKDLIDMDRAKAAARFKQYPEQLPSTLDACLQELQYWNQLYWLRQSVGECGDGAPETTAREWFAYDLLAEITPRSFEESIRVMDWLDEQDKEVETATYRNLMSHPGREARTASSQETAVEYQCGCGDIYPGSSFGAGYMAANNGVCENCSVAGVSRG